MSLIIPEVLDSQEIVRQATEFYEQELRLSLEAEREDLYVTIEPISRTYYLGQQMSDATRQARSAFPNRRIYLMRVGHETVVQFGLFE